MLVGGEHVLVDPDLRRPYETDWTGAYKGRAAAVVRPGNTAEVAAIARLGMPLVPQGGNTGLVGGSVPDDTGTAVVLSTLRLRELGAVNTSSAQVTVGAGVTLGALQAHARASGLDVGVDLAARDSATIGGMVATNAGGTRVLRYGTMRHQLVGVEAVLASGEVISHLGGLEKDNTGYDLAGLLCGSEGTLAVITRVRIKLVPVYPHRVTALLAFEDLSSAVTGLARLRTVAGLDAAEYMVRRGIDLVRSTFGVPEPFRREHPAYLLVEASGAVDPTAELAAAISTLDVLDVAVASSAKDRERLWALRELHTEALTRAGPPHKYDVSVPLDRVAPFVAEVLEAVDSPSRTCHHFGHLGDGNVHLNVLGDLADELIFGIVNRYEGSISAEHGIGRLKQPWLHLSRSASELAVFASIKAALDPIGMLNPGVLLS
jgi:FAD/FMN-containing dehydrogenase